MTEIYDQLNQFNFFMITKKKLFLDLKIIIRYLMDF